MGGAREVKIGLPDDRDNAEHSVVDLREISEIFVYQNGFFFGMGPFYQVYP